MWLGVWCLFWTGCSVAAVAAAVVVAAAAVGTAAAADFAAAVASARPNLILVANCDWGWHRGRIERKK